ncbi:isopenicillin N synthase family dioxygenase [Gilvimarinus agarilyticus]|uniref:isopenicillin N synthase family dioxygenase n=1 Tax=Gilvimarinus agarilyticus TaxID=679259 RepID=UPI0005A2A7A4|nr:2-oxoglutarate and iron-dependent oxygenase domain-containing protein [Gilvimarinus agarilyticus]
MASSNTPSSHTAFTELPKVDISGLRSSDLQDRLTVAEQLGKAAREVGFLYITGHGIDPALSENLKARTRDFFAQPLAQKMRYYIGQSVNHSGYVPEGEEQFGDGNIDHKETYDVNFDYLPEAGRRPMLGPTQWPDDDAFKRDVKAYYDAALNVSQSLFRGFALALGLPEDTLTKLVTTPPSQLRLIHYPFNASAPQDRPGIGAHTDYECFTILLPTAPGLEVLNGAGEWIDVPLVDNAFVINIGDMLEVLSNGEFVATSHRVRKVQEERYSFPLFCACDYDTVISPLLAAKEADDQNRYAAINCGEHLYAQTIQTFQYLKTKLDQGEIQMPEGSKGLSSFGYHSEAQG